MLQLDPWQEEILSSTGNILLCSGRQQGKSTIISHYAADFVIKNKNKSVLIISATERQALELFLKTLHYIQDNYKDQIKGRPTLHFLELKNGSIIRSLPAGDTGEGVRGYTLDILLVDEASFISDFVFDALTPSLLTTGGQIILVSTPKGKQGYFWKSYNNPNFKVFHINAEENIKTRPISESWSEKQREDALAHFEREKASMTRNAYLQEYCGVFVEDLRQLFPDELIKKCQSQKRRTSISPVRTYFCGVDVARLGEDLSVFSIVDRTDRKHLFQVESISTSKTRINETTDEILRLDLLYNFKAIYVDDAGVGSGVFDYLLIHPRTKRKAVAINNSARSLDQDDEHTKKILKEDLYNNLLGMMERGEIELLDDDEIFLSLKSVQYEYIVKSESPTKFRIFGNWTHHAESLIRACWCARDKRLNIWCR